MLFEQIEPKFVNKVEDLALNNGGSYIDAVVDACDYFNIEPKVGATFLSKPIIEKIESEGHEFNLLPCRSKLPI